MVKNRFLGFLAAGMLLAPMAANAVVITWDNLNQTVVRPVTGTASVDFFATVTFDPTEAFAAAVSNVACMGLECLYVNFDTTVFSSGYSLRFHGTVDSTTSLGLYDSGPDGVAFYLVGAGSPGRYLPYDRYTINVVEATTVPEPTTLALFGMGLVGVALTRRRQKA